MNSICAAEQQRNHLVWNSPSSRAATKEEESDVIREGLLQQAAAQTRAAEENTFQAGFHAGMFRLQIKEHQRIQTIERESGLNAGVSRKPHFPADSAA